MPLKSKKQLRYCWVKYQSQLAKNETPSWDCRKWAKETPDIKSLPDEVNETAGCGCALRDKAGKSHSPKRRKSVPKKKSPKTKRKLKEGPRGGLYYVKGGKKIWVKK